MKKRILTKLTQEDFEIIKNFNKEDHKTLSDFIISFFNYDHTRKEEDIKYTKRAIIFIEALLEPMVYLRDKGDLTLTPTFLINNLQFIKCLFLAGNLGIPHEKRANLIKYFDIYKEYEREKILNIVDEKYKEEAYIQHSYVTMQFTEILCVFESMLHPNSLEIRKKLNLL